MIEASATGSGYMPPADNMSYSIIVSSNPVPYIQTFASGVLFGVGILFLAIVVVGVFKRMFDATKQ